MSNAATTENVEAGSLDRLVQLSPAQLKAIARLKRALDECARVGLTGGVYEGSFSIWPENMESPHEAKAGFFETIERCGANITTKMRLDGGAGW